MFRAVRQQCIPQAGCHCPLLFLVGLRKLFVFLRAVPRIELDHWAEVNKHNTTQIVNAGFVAPRQHAPVCSYPFPLGLYVLYSGLFERQLEEINRDVFLIDQRDETYETDVGRLGQHTNPSVRISSSPQTVRENSGITFRRGWCCHFVANLKEISVARSLLWKSERTPLYTHFFRYDLSEKN